MYIEIRQRMVGQAWMKSAPVSKALWRGPGNTHSCADACFPTSLYTLEITSIDYTRQWMIGQNKLLDELLDRLYLGSTRL